MIFPHDFYGFLGVIRHTTRLAALRKTFVFRTHASLYRIIIVIIIIIIINIITSIICSIICFQIVLTFLFSNHSRNLSYHILPTLGVGPTPVAPTKHFAVKGEVLLRHEHCQRCQSHFEGKIPGRKKKNKQGRKGVGGALVNNFKAFVCTYSFFDFVSPICFKWIETTR